MAIEEAGIEGEADRNRQGLFSRAARGASDRVLDIVDPDVILEHVDVNALLERIDINTLLDRVDINALLAKVDVDALMSRADIDAIVDRMDIAAIVQKAGIPEIVAESTSHLTGSALDLLRRPFVGLDEIVFRGLNRLFRRDISAYPTGPGQLIEWVDTHAEPDESVKTGRFAGPVTRLIALILDASIVTAGFTVTLAGISFLVGLIDKGFDITDTDGVWFVVAAVLWVFFYALIGLGVFGKTLGKAVMGLRVVRSDGSLALHGRQAFVRVLTYPLSFIVFGIGLLGAIFGRERQCWHDHFAHTAVVYDWGSRTAHMPIPLAEWLNRRQEKP